VTLVQSFPVARGEGVTPLFFAGALSWPQQDGWFIDFSCSELKLVPHDPQQQQAAVWTAGLDASALANSSGQRQTKCGIPATKIMIAVR